jgi:membrane protease YdiL (CAAX protease family)
VTGILFLLVHLPDGAARMALLLPAVVVLSLARHFGGSVRATIIIHALNNATAFGTPWLALWLGWLAWP